MRRTGSALISLGLMVGIASVGVALLPLQLAGLAWLLGVGAVKLGLASAVGLMGVGASLHRVARSREQAQLTAGRSHEGTHREP